MTAVQVETSGDLVVLTVGELAADGHESTILLAPGEAADLAASIGSAAQEADEEWRRRPTR